MSPPPPLQGSRDGDHTYAPQPPANDGGTYVQSFPATSHGTKKNGGCSAPPGPPVGTNYSDADVKSDTSEKLESEADSASEVQPELELVPESELSLSWTLSWSWWKKIGQWGHNLHPACENEHQRIVLHN